MHDRDDDEGEAVGAGSPGAEGTQGDEELEVGGGGAAHEGDPGGAPPDRAPPDEGDSDEEDPHEEDHPEDGVVLLPFPGTQRSALFGLTGVGALEGGEAPSVLAGELPGERLLEVRAPRPGSGLLACVLVLAGALACSPLVIYFDFRATRGFQRMLGDLGPESLVPTTFLLMGLGVVLGLWAIASALLGRATLTFTSEGVALDAPSGATWLEWDELRSYRVEGSLLHLRGDDVEIASHVAPEELGPVCKLLDERGVDRD